MDPYLFFVIVSMGVIISNLFLIVLKQCDDRDQMTRERITLVEEGLLEAMGRCGNLSSQNSPTPPSSLLFDSGYDEA